MKQVLKLEAIGHRQRDASHDWLRLIARLGALDDLPRVKNPWVARILGLTERGGLARAFVEPQVDYSEANSVGSRGVYFYFPLDEGHVYEVFSRRSWKASERYFVYPEFGRMRRLDREEVVAWLAR